MKGQASLELLVAVLVLVLCVRFLRRNIGAREKICT